MNLHKHKIKAKPLNVYHMHKTTNNNGNLSQNTTEATYLNRHLPRSLMNSEAI
ncbi:hypothetical protein C1H46_045840 [Malus baccata]|uniref:Uncharacterized protein n=1 Tax=Malus baccata TaxID=106549 RepID=A0A540K2W3_MALBA|nr:hypothetical protein C1H46_045840 [Malus baccata]